MAENMGEMVKRPNVALKFVELLFGIISIGVVIDGYPVATSYPKLATIYGTQIGFIMLSLVVIMSFLMSTPLHKTILLIVSGVGFVMWLVAGALIVDTYVSNTVSWGGFTFKPEDRLVVSGVFALCNAVAYLVDAGLSFKG